MATMNAGFLLVSRYRFDRFIARGGMGEVWAALDTQLEAPVAIKVMSPTMLASNELVVRFEREAKASAQIRSPHAVQVLGHGVDRGLPFIVMELLEGEDLAKRLKRRDRLTLTEVAEIIRSVCKALRRAHDLGIVHRDLKPANIFHSRQDEEEVVKVLDFGIAMLSTPDVDGRVTSTGAILGTAHYMAPEQAKLGARRVDHRADLWSVGVIAFRALTGQLPFPGHALEVIQKLVTAEAPVPSSIISDLPPAVDGFFKKALARDPNGRFQSARELAAAFQELLPATDQARAPLLSLTSEAFSPLDMGPPLRSLAKTVRMTSGEHARVVAEARAKAMGAQPDADDLAATVPRGVRSPSPPSEQEEILASVAASAHVSGPAMSPSDLEVECLAETVVRTPSSPIPPPPPTAHEWSREQPAGNSWRPAGLTIRSPNDGVASPESGVRPEGRRKRRVVEGWLVLVVSLVLLVSAGVIGITSTCETGVESPAARP